MAPAAPDASTTRYLPYLVAGAFFMENLDATVITTALPEMARSFGVAPAQLSIGISADLRALAVFIPLSGWLADRFGPRRIFGGIWLASSRPIISAVHPTADSRKPSLSKGRMPPGAPRIQRKASTSPTKPSGMFR